jgi:antitoxin MazE
MNAKIIQIGNSKGIILPKSIIVDYKLEDELQIELREDCIVLKPVVKDPRAGWEEIYKNAANKLTKEEKEWLNFKNSIPEEWTW